MTIATDDMAKCDVWMPLYIGDYLSNTGRLTTEQHGAYMLLIMDYWVSGRLPNDDNALAAITRLPLDKWLIVRKTLSRFFTVTDSEWIQERIESEKERAEYLSRVRAEAGSKGGSKTQANIAANGQANDKHGLTPSQSPSPLPPESPSKPEKKNFSPPSVDQVIKYFVENGFPIPLAKRVFESYNVADWHDSNGKKILNWKQKMQNVWFKPENKADGKPQTKLTRAMAAIQNANPVRNSQPAISQDVGKTTR